MQASDILNEILSLRKQYRKTMISSENIPAFDDEHLRPFAEKYGICHTEATKLIKQSSVKPEDLVNFIPALTKPVTMAEPVYFHVTTKDRLDSILEKGLLPDKGKNSEKCGDSRNCIYLCTEDEIPHWAFLLDADICLAITDPTFVPNDRFIWSEHLSEAVTDFAIAPCYLTEHPIPSMKRAIEELKVSYFRALSEYVFYTVRAYCNKKLMAENPEKQEYTDMINNTGANYMEILGKLKYTEDDIPILQEILIKMGEEGEYTMCDHFKTSEPRLYQIFNELVDPETEEMRHKIYDFIVNTFKGCLTVETGGYNGD